MSAGGAKKDPFNKRNLRSGSGIEFSFYVALSLEMSSLLANSHRKKKWISYAKVNS